MFLIAETDIQGHSLPPTLYAKLKVHSTEHTEDMIPL